MTLPAIKDVKDLLEGLLGRDVATTPGPLVDPGDQPAPTVAVYVDPTNRLSSVVLVDLPLTVYLGAALALTPKGHADGAVDDGIVPLDLHENTAEVLNVLAAVLGDSSGVHQRLYATYSAEDAVPQDAQEWAARLGSRLDLDVDVKGYGGGAMSIVSAVLP